MDLLMPNASTTKKGIVELATDNENAANVVVQGNDSRLANNAPSSAQYVTLATDATLTNERILTSGDGFTMTDAGAGSALTVAYNPLDFLQKHIVLMEEFEKEVTNVANQYLVSVSGTAASFTNNADGVYVGVPFCATGSTTTGRAGIMFDNSTKFISFIFGQGQMIGATSIKIPVASTVAQEYIIRVGFIDSLTGNPVDGVWFEYDRLTSTNWITCTSNNSTPTKTTSSTAVAIDANLRLKIVVNAAGTSAEFFVNDVSIGTNTTNIPTTLGGTRDTSYGASIIKSAGTNSLNFYIFYMIVDFKLTNTR